MEPTIQKLGKHGGCQYIIGVGACYPAVRQRTHWRMHRTTMATPTKIAMSTFNGVKEGEHVHRAMLRSRHTVACSCGGPADIRDGNDLTMRRFHAHTHLAIRDTMTPRILVGNSSAPMVNTTGIDPPTPVCIRRSGSYRCGEEARSTSTTSDSRTPGPTPLTSTCSTGPVVPTRHRNA